MMKEVVIKVRVNEGKIASAIQTEGYDRNDISHQLELLGIIENTKFIIQARIEKLGELNTNSN